MKLSYSRTSRAGYSLLELLIAATLLVVMLGSTTTVLFTSAGTFERTGISTRTQAQARRALDRAARELANAGIATLVPDPDPFGSEDITFQTATGVVGTTVQWSPLSRLVWQYEPDELDDGADNDGDGLIDEGTLSFTRDWGGPDEHTIILARGVSEYLEGETGNGLDDNGNGLSDERGFSIQGDGELMILRLTVERMDERRQLFRSTVTTGVRLRN